MSRMSCTVAFLAMIVIGAGTALAAPPIWEPSFGTRLGLTDDSTTSQTFATLNFTFPFVGTTYTGADELWISSNGFISLGVDNGSDCCAGDPAALVAEGPRIAAFWADHRPDDIDGNDVYLNAFNDDGDPENDRVVITWNDHLYDNGQPILAQIQLLEDGTVILGYNGYDLTGFNDDTLIGLSPGGGVADPGTHRPDRLDTLQHRHRADRLRVLHRCPARDRRRPDQRRVRAQRAGRLGNRPPGRAAEYYRRVGRQPKPARQVRHASGAIHARK